MRLTFLSNKDEEACRVRASKSRKPAVGLYLGTAEAAYGRPFLSNGHDEPSFNIVVYHMGWYHAL